MQTYLKKHVNLPNGERYAYLEIGEGENLLLLHGNMSSSVHFMPILPTLSQKYRCVAPDLRGFGDSSFFKPFFSLEQLADDVKLFCDILGIGQAYVVGWSTGGGIALKLAAKYPYLVKKLFSIEGASHRGYPIFAKDQQGNPIIGKAYRCVEEMSQDKVQVAPMHAYFKTKNLKAISAVWDSLIYVANKPTSRDNEVFLEETAKQVCLPYLDWALANFNMSQTPTAYGMGDGTIKNVVCPCAFTEGELDCVVPPFMVKENLDALKGSVRLVYQNCGHSPLVDCPDRLVADIKSFFG